MNRCLTRNFVVSESKHKPPGQPVHRGEPKQSGRVAFDARGNPVWEWATATGKFDRNVSTQRLKKLEAKDLTLMDTAAVVPQSKKLALEEPPPMPGGGMNPYDTAVTPKVTGAHKPDPSRRSLVTKQAKIKPKLEPEGAWDKLKRRFFDK